jgi:hypothetical protein
MVLGVAMDQRQNNPVTSEFRLQLLTAPPHDRPIPANGPGVQRNTDTTRQQGNGMVAGD